MGFKLNSNGAVDEIGGFRGVGAVIRDHKGEFMTVFAMCGPNLIIRV